jgi:chromosomal replication initiator protein
MSPTHPQARCRAGLWQACIEQLAQDLPEQQFNTWIKPLVAQVAEDFSKVTLLVANRFKLDWIRAQYAGRIAALLEGFTASQSRWS